MLADRGLIELRSVVKRFPVGRHDEITALAEVDLDIQQGTTVGLVGESGCGKSTLARMVAGMERPTSGSLHFAGEPMYDERGMPPAIAQRRIQIVLQDPVDSLDPRMRVGASIAEPLRTMRPDLGRDGRRVRAREVMELVGVDPDSSRLFPHEFSGGQRQRVAIARAIAVRPDVLVLDEPTASVDSSIRAQLLVLLGELQSEFGLTYLVVSHDLAVIRHIADRTAVMYLGQIVEIGSTDDVVRRPRHPYTRALLDAVPDMRRKRAPVLPGEATLAAVPPHGCPFAPRCPRAEERCWNEQPEPRDLDGVEVRCHLA